MKSVFLRYAGGWEDARQKLKNIVALAYDSLHAELKARFLVDRANAGEFGVRFHEVQRVAHMLNKDYISTAATICRMMLKSPRTQP